jgi:transposase-like protein
VCLLVMIGVRADGTKELVFVSDGFRESRESWADLLRDCKRRGMTAPVLAVGDGALGFRKAIRDVFPDTKEQRCWWHKIGNVLAALAKSAHPAAKKALAGIYNAENKAAAVKATHTFAAEYGAKWPKAVAKIVDDLDVLTAFYDDPAEHGIRLRATDERFKARVALSAGWDGVSLVGGRGRPRSEEQGRGAGSPAAQLAP